MRHTQTLRATLLVATAAAGAACTPRSDTPPVGEATPVTPDHRAVSGPPATSSPSDEPLDRAGAPVFGHVAVFDAKDLLGRIREHAAPPRIHDMFETEPLVGLGVGLAGLPSGLSTKIDLARPFGCVVGDLSTGLDVACVFGYRGGAGELARDFEVPAGSDAQGHAAAVTLHGLPLFIDALGDDVVVSASPTIFGAARAYLQRNIVERSVAARPDLEIVVYADELVTRHEERLAAFYVSEEDRLGAQLAGADARVRQAVTTYAQHHRALERADLKKLGEYRQLTLHARVGAEGIALGVHAIPRPGGRFPTGSLTRGRTIPPALVKNLPAGVLACFAFNVDPWALAGFNRHTSGAITDDDVRGSIAMASAVWGALTTQPPADAEAAITEHLLEARRLYAGPTVWALVDEPGTPFALLGVRELTPGTSGRDSWLAWSRRMTPEVVLGGGAGYLTWSFVPAAMTIDGFIVDRWIFRPAQEADQKALEVDVASFAPALARGLVVDRMEAHGHVYYAIAPGSEESFLRRVLEARAGKGSLDSDTHVAAVITRDPASHVLFGLDLAALRNALASRAELARMFDLDPLALGDVGAGLDDVYLHYAETEAGVLRGSLVVGPAVLKWLKGEP